MNDTTHAAALFSPAWAPIDKNLSNHPNWVQAWLSNRGSLTANINNLIAGEITVKVLRHGFQPAPGNALKTLDVTAEEPVLHREVLLCEGETPLVFACSLIPESVLEGKYSALRDLGNSPLGHWIFQEPALRRTNVHTATLRNTNPVFMHAPESESTSLHGRRSCFSGTDKPIIVSEFFLPAMETMVPKNA